MANVISYIQNQELHHQKVTFLDEFKMLLNKFNVEYDERYIFKHIQWSAIWFHKFLSDKA